MTLVRAPESAIPMATKTDTEKERWYVIVNKL